ncbi:MAG TPA: hypothetical protein VFR80_07355, partial [Pyrinomonadaceae bacterium]|nr:hypothetical protein [Pyrinomonadaceae bacterium]
MTQVLGFITGTTLSGLLLVLVWRAERLGGNSHQGSLTVLLLLVWNAGSLIRYASLVMGFESASAWANVFAYSATALLPTAGLLLLRQRQGSWRHSAGTVMKYVSLMIGVTLSLALFV